MKRIYIFFISYLPVMLLALAVMLPAEALAQQTKSKTTTQKKGLSSGVRSALTTLRGKNIYTSKTTVTTRTIADTTTKIRSVGKNPTTGSYSVTIELAQDAPQLQVQVYNILGRKVADIWKGDASKGDVITRDFTQEVQGLPEGMYICVAQGKDFRLAEKFIVSR